MIRDTWSVLNVGCHKDRSNLGLRITQYVPSSALTLARVETFRRLVL